MGYTMLIDESGAFPTPLQDKPLGVLATILAPTDALNQAALSLQRIRSKHRLPPSFELKASDLWDRARAHSEARGSSAAPDPLVVIADVATLIADIPSAVTIASYCKTENVHRYLDAHPRICMTPACADAQRRTYRMGYQNLLQRAAKHLGSVDAVLDRLIIDHQTHMHEKYRRAHAQGGYTNDVRWIEEWHDLLVRRRKSWGQPLDRICREPTIWRAARSDLLQLADFAAHAFYSWLSLRFPEQYRPLAPLVRRYDGVVGQAGLICMPTKDEFRLPEERLQAILRAAGGGEFPYESMGHETP